MTLTEIAIKRPSLIIVIFLTLILGGLMSYNYLRYELIPEFSLPVLAISTTYPGASPAEVEQQVTKKIEDAISSLGGIKRIESNSLENISLVIVHLSPSVNVELALQDAQRKIDNAMQQLPPDVDPPRLDRFSPSDMPFMQILATSNMSEEDLYDLMDTEMLPQLLQIPGVASIDLLGATEREIQIRVDKDKMKAYGLSILQVKEAVNAANIDFPSGEIKTGPDAYKVRLRGKFVNLDEIRDLTVASPAGLASPVRVRDVAEVSRSIKKTESVARYNGRNGMGLLVKKQRDGNAVEISAIVREKIKAMEKEHAAREVHFTIANDDTDFTIEAVDAVQHDLILAIILVAAVMLLFLHSLRNAFIVLIAIPTSLISTFIVMAVLDYSFNLMTLLAMSLVIGILVDDSIVVLENIQRHLEMGKKRRRAALDGRNEIGFSALTITMVDVVVFLPIIIFVQTTVGDLLRQFSVIVVVSTLMSLFVCFTLTPWLASRLAKVEHLNPRNPLQWLLIQFERMINALTGWYAARLSWALRNKFVSLVIVMACFVGMGWMMGLSILGEEFVADGDQGKLSVRLEYDKSLSVEENNLRTREIEKDLMRDSIVSSVFANIAGPNPDVMGSGESNRAELSVTLIPAEQRSISTEKYMIAKLQELQARYPSVRVGGNVLSLKGGEAPIQLVLYGDDYDSLVAAGQKVQAIIEKLPGASDVKTTVKPGRPEFNVEIDREKLARLGLDMRSVGATLRAAFEGTRDESEYEMAGKEYNIRVMLDEFDRADPADVSALTVLNAHGEPVRVDQFASLSQTTGPSKLERKNRRASLKITAYNLGATSGMVANEITEHVLNAGVLPPGITASWTGDIENMAESMSSLMQALLIGFICIYLLMVALYDNFVYPFVVLFSIPVALIGAFMALNLAISSMSVFTMLGVIMLLGLVAKNAILLVDFANHAKAEGMNSFDALIAAGRERLRPILMTTVAMVVGMAPLALASGAGSEWKNGLALVLVGGLTSSMMLTVFVVPMAYHTVDSVGAFFRRLLRRRGRQKVQRRQDAEEERYHEPAHFEA